LSKRILITRTVFFDEESDAFCTCVGDFWKTCRLRVINSLPCIEALVSITPIDRAEKDPASSEIKSLSTSFDDLTDQIRNLENKFKI
jgi:hypothetical protein